MKYTGEQLISTQAALGDKEVVGGQAGNVGGDRGPHSVFIISRGPDANVATPGDEEGRPLLNEGRGAVLPSTI